MRSIVQYLRNWKAENFLTVNLRFLLCVHAWNTWVSCHKHKYASGQILKDMSPFFVAYSYFYIYKIIVLNVSKTDDVIWEGIMTEAEKLMIILRLIIMNNNSEVMIRSPECTWIVSVVWSTEICYCIWELDENSVILFLWNFICYFTTLYIAAY